MKEMIMQRRSMLFASAAILPLGLLARCAGTQGAVTLEQAQAYMTDASGAVLAAAQAYLASTPPPNVGTADAVRALMANLEAVRQALSGAVAVADWKAGALEGLSLLQQLSPLVMVYLGPAGPVIPVAIAVIQAFVDALPPPADAPVVPPAALHRKALEYRPHHH
jgi:hypothetical protein